jgi:predicted nucleic acid-binding protein
VNGSLVVDASVAVKWVLAESDSELAQQIVHASLLAPDLLLIECGNAIWWHAQLGEVDPAEVPQLWAVLRAMPVEIVASPELVEPALDLAVALNHPIYDCLYLALALDRGARVVSTDRRFLAASRRRRDLVGAVVLLSELAH